MNIRKQIIKLLNNIIFKDKKLIVLDSKPDFSDNAMALYERMKQDSRFDGYKIIWIVAENSSLERRPDIKAYYKLSIYGLWIYLRAKCVLSTHGLFAGTLAKSQIHISLTHGMPLKRYKALAVSKYTNLEKEFNYALATSDLFVNIQAACFQLDCEKVFVTGLPRNDYLVHSDDSLVRLGINKLKKVVLWLPTYRTPATENKEHNVRQTGENYQLGIPYLDTENVLELDKKLNSINLVIIVKLHMLQKFNKKILPKLQNIIFLTADDCLEKSIDLYHLMACVDALITDYSSVYIDFISTGKPIAFTIDDMDKYNKDRGFVFDNPLEYMPGIKIQNSYDFMQFLFDISNGVDRAKNEREKKRLLLNQFDDDHNSDRVLDIIYKLLHR